MFLSFIFFLLYPIRYAQQKNLRSESSIYKNSYKQKKEEIFRIKFRVPTMMVYIMIQQWGLDKVEGFASLFHTSGLKTGAKKKMRARGIRHARAFSSFIFDFPTYWISKDLKSRSRTKDKRKKKIDKNISEKEVCCHTISSVGGSRSSGSNLTMSNDWAATGYAS